MKKRLVPLTLAEEANDGTLVDDMWGPSATEYDMENVVSPPDLSSDAQYESKIVSLESVIKNLEQEKGHQSGEIIRLNKKISDLESNLNQTTNKCDRLTQENLKLKETISELQKEMSEGRNSRESSIPKVSISTSNLFRVFMISIRS